MIQKIIEKIHKLNFIKKSESFKIFNEVYNNNIKEKIFLSFLICIKIRNYYIEEILGSIKLLINKSVKIPKINYLFCDIVGTGGDNINSINISTLSAFIISKLGLKVIKHGNFGISSISGSFDILSKIKINLNVKKNKLNNILNKFGLCFLFAPNYNSIFKKIIKIRKKIKHSTIFNIIGPLINPSKPPIILIGVNNINLIILIIKILKILKYKNAAVVHGGGMDEVVIHSNTYVAELKNNFIKTYQLEPKKIGLNIYPLNKILSYNKKENFLKFVNILNGKGKKIYNEIISINVSLLLKLFGNENIKKNIKIALKIIKNGNNLIKF